MIKSQSKAAGQDFEGIEITGFAGGSLLDLLFEPTPHLGLLERIFFQHPVKRPLKPFAPRQRIFKRDRFPALQRGEIQPLRDVFAQRVVFGPGDENGNQELNGDFPKRGRSGVVMGADQQRTDISERHPGLVVFAARRGQFAENGLGPGRAGRAGSVEGENLENACEPFQGFLLMDPIGLSEVEVKFLIRLGRIARLKARSLQSLLEPLPIFVSHSWISNKFTPSPVSPGLAS